MLNLERSRNNVAKISQENPSPVYATIDALLYSRAQAMCRGLCQGVQEPDHWATFSD